MYSFSSVVALGLDSFLACTAIGLRSRPWREQWRIALAFGGCDALSTLLGSFWWHRTMEPAAIVLWLIGAFLFLRTAPRNRALVYAIAVLFSLDNLFVGSPAAMAPLITLSSATMGLLGLSLGAACRRTFLTLATESSS